MIELLVWWTPFFIISFVLGLIYARLGKVIDLLFLINENLIILAENLDGSCDDPDGGETVNADLKPIDDLNKTIDRLRTVVNAPRRAA